MHTDAFFVEPAVAAFGVGGLGSPEVNVAMFRKLRAGPLAAYPDAEVGVPLARFLHDELVKYGTGRGEVMGDEQIREALLALKEVCQRLGVTYAVPFRDFTDFRAWWLRNNAGGSGGWAARRSLLSGVFDPMHDRLEALEQASLTATLAVAVSPQEQTGWPSVDAEVVELRRQFLNASTSQDYNAVGLVCVRVLEAVSGAAYDASRHLEAGAVEPPIANTKARLERVVEIDLAGQGNAELRKLARSVIEAAQAVKHGGTPSQKAAGIAADAVILLANVIRRIVAP